MNNAEFTEKYYMKKRADSSVKWQRGRQMNCLPMWVADMDFRCDERIAEHLKKFIEIKLQKKDFPAWSAKE